MEGESEDSLFIRTEDSICLSSTTSPSPGKTQVSHLFKRFGQTNCYVEREKNFDKVPCNLWNYKFDLEEAISVHAIHGWKKSEKTSTRKMVMYGQAVLISTYGKVLRCFSYDNQAKGNDKDKHINYQIGYLSREEKDKIDATCWFTIHPTTKRQTGERVHAGDEVYLVNVATKRYLSIFSNSSGAMDEYGDELDKAVATFTPWSWTIHIMSSGMEKENFTGYLNGGDIIQIKLHSSKDEYMSIPLSRGQSNPLKSMEEKGNKKLCFEDKSVALELRSLWGVQLLHLNFGGAFIQWGQPIRLLHISSGKYLGVIDERIVMVEASKADRDVTAFCFVKSSAPKRHTFLSDASMGKPSVKFGESEVLLYHLSSEVWIGLETIGRAIRRRRGAFTTGPSTAFVHADPPQNTSFIINKNLTIALSASTANELETNMKILANAMSVNDEFKEVSQQLQNVSLMCFNEALVILKPPNKDNLNTHEYQRELMLLKNRQLRLNNHGTVKMTFGLLKLSSDHYKAFPSPLGVSILTTLCKLLAALTTGNPTVCKDFASEKCLNSLIDLLILPYLTHSLLEVLDCLIENSPEALSYITEQHVESFVKLLNVNGREVKIMKLLGKLCICQDLAMRDKQQQVCRHLLKSTDLLIQPQLLTQINCFYANIFIDVKGRGDKWYYELHWKADPSTVNPHMRVGFALYHIFRPNPTSNGDRVNEGGIGDCFTSLGFDGKYIWIGGSKFMEEKTRPSRSPRLIKQQSTQHSPPSSHRTSVTPPTSDDIDCIGCVFDTLTQCMWFTLNGRTIPIRARLSSDMDHIPLGEVFVVPAISISGGMEKAELRFGGNYGELLYKPPEGSSPIYLHEKGKDINIRPFVDLGDKQTGHLKGPQIIAGQIPFIPSVIDISQVEVTEVMNKLINELPYHIHESMARTHLLNGWKYGPTINYEAKTHPSLKAFVKSEDSWEYKMARSVILTLGALGCVLSESLVKPELKYELLDRTNFQSLDGYCPNPLITIDPLPRSLTNLKECLAENMHNSWAEQKLDEGFRYGLKNNYKAKTLSTLLPYHSLPHEDTERNRSIMNDVLSIIITIGYNIQPPMMDFSQNLDDTFTQMPFRTYRGQFYQYCTGHGKWYFTIKLIKGQLLRIGWLTHGFNPSNPVGGDEYSYAVDGFRANKWHNGKPEKFGRKWKIGDTIICLLDLDRRTMSFAIGDTLLQDPSQDTVAFSGIDPNRWYIPAVTLYLAEEAEFNLGKMGDGGAESVAAAGFEGVQINIKSSIPLWYSDDFPVFKSIKSGHSVYSTEYTSTDITVNTNKIGTKACFKLNTGIPILSSKDETDAVVSLTLSIPASQDTESVFLGWCTPEWIYNEEYWNENVADSIYSSKVEVLGMMDRITDVENVWKVNKEHCSAFIVKLGGLTDHERITGIREIRVHCILNVNNGEMKFYADGYAANEVTLKASIPSKVFPILITTPAQSCIAKFILKPIESCMSLKKVIFGAKVDSRLQDDVLASMEVLHCAKSTWRQINTQSSLSKPIAATVNGCTVPSLTQQKLLFLMLPMEERVLRFSEIFEDAIFAEFHLEICNTLKACCMCDNVEAGKEVKKMFTWEQLLYCIKSSYWDYSIRAAYFDLFNTLHLEHLVNSQLVVQNDHIFAIKSKQDGEYMYDNRRNSLAYSALTNEISVETSVQQLAFQFPVNDLKSVLFSFLEKLMMCDIFTCRMLSPFDTTEILRPLLVAMNGLIVLRLVKTQEEIQRVLNLLHPAFSGNKSSKAHQALLTMKTEEPVKMILCDLLEHLCNCQLQSRLEHVVKFAETYVGELQDEQRERVEDMEMSSTVLQEINTPTEKQVKAILAFTEDTTYSSCPTSKELQYSLRRFHSKVKSHCGIPKQHSSEQNSVARLAKLKQLVFNITEHNRPFVQDASSTNTNVTMLQEVVKGTVIKWARTGIKSTALMEKAFQLLYRQFNETEELMKTIGSTYVVERVSEESLADIIEFRESLGHVRNLMRIGMGEEEERTLEDKLKILQQSKLFQKHPDLLRLTGVHVTSMNIIKSYLSFNTSLKGKKDIVRIRLERKRKMAVSGGGFAGPVEECCKFLQAFTKTSRQNQMVMFEYIPYLLDQCCKYPDRLACDSCSPMEVASSIIKDNLELALALTEDIFKQVMVLMEKMTYGYQGNTDSESDTPPSGEGTSPYSSMSMEWSPFGSLKCLKFLYAAVWVNGETVVQNATVIIRLLIQYPDSLGPGTLGKNLGIVAIFQDSMSMLSGPCKRKLTHQETTTVRFERGYATLDKKSSSTLSLNSSTVDIAVAFYTFLVRLLAFCAPVKDTQSVRLTASTSLPPPSSLSSDNDHVIPFLQSLISFEDVKKVLSMPLSTLNDQGIRPKQKQAMLMFLDRVYSCHDPKFFLYLIKEIFLNDIMCNTYLCKEQQSKYALVDFYRYLCDYILPYLKRHAVRVHTYTMEEVAIVTDFIKACHQIIRGGKVSPFHRKKLDSWLVTISIILPPQVFLRLFPEVASDIQSKNISTFNTAVKTLTSHFEHYKPYYSRGVPLKSFNCHPPARQSKIFISLLVGKLMETASNSSHDKVGIMQCLRALISAITPECLTPNLRNTSVLLNQIAYHECFSPTHHSPNSEPMCDSPTDSINSQDSGSHVDSQIPSSPIDNVSIPKELLECIDGFADYCHNLWVYKKQQVDHWIYGREFDSADQRNPNLRPFTKLSEEDQQTLLTPIRRCVQELLIWGYVFTHKKPFNEECLPTKLQQVCIRMPKKKKGVPLTIHQEYASFVPSKVLDLAKVPFKNETNFQVTAESTAIVLNDLLHVCGCHHPSIYDPLHELYKGEGYKETCSFIIDLLKFFQIKGLLCCGAFTALPGNFMSSSHVKYIPFGQQLFDEFLSSLKQQSCCYQAFLSPLIKHYLECHASYFNPLIDTRETTQLYATTAEKIQIAKMLSNYLEYLNSHTDQMLSNSIVGAGKLFKPPCLPTIKEANEASIQQVLSLCVSLLQALDLQEEEVQREISLFIQSAAGILDDFPAIIEKEARGESTVMDMKFLIYCQHILIPVILEMFVQLTSYSSSSKFHMEIISAQTCNVFQNLFNPVKAHTEIFINSGSLMAVGNCLSALSMFYGCEVDVFGNNIDEMMEKLKWAAAKRYSGQFASFVGCVVVPLLSSIFKLESSDKKKTVTFLKLCLRLLHEYQGDPDAIWTYTLCASISMVIHSCPVSVFSTHILPILRSLSDRCTVLWDKEKLLFSSIAANDLFVIQNQRNHAKELAIFSRDVLAIMKFLYKLLKSLELSIAQSFGPILEHDIVTSICNILDYYYSSQRFASKLDSIKKAFFTDTSVMDSRTYLFNTLLLCGDAMLKSLQPVTIQQIDQFQSLFSGDKSITAIEAHIGQVIRKEEVFLENIDKVLEDSKSEWRQYRRRSQEFDNSERYIRILAYTKHFIQQHQKSKFSTRVHGRWKTLMTRQKREAVLSCLKAIPFYKLKKHRSVNLFLSEYSKTWLANAKESNMERLCERLLDQEDYETSKAKRISTFHTHDHDPLTLLFSMFTMLASTQQWGYVDGVLYEKFCEAIVETTKWIMDDEEGAHVETGAAKEYERFHNRLALATNKQKQLLQKGIPSMILQVLAASKGGMNSLVHVTIKLGLVLLEGGNSSVQQSMLERLSSMDADVVSSIRDLVVSCSVLDLSSYERNYLSASYDKNIAKKVFPSSEEVVDLFRFLQLLCEGHNEDFQDYLRTQDNTTTAVNIVVATVDYLLKLQESVRDFYWHHAHQDSLELPARECFLVSFQVSRQVFRTLTEYIQGPCTGNQMTLAQSRLWDAVSGYFHIFTSLQEKLFAHVNHMELLREVLDLEEEFFILLLSMLEGNTISSSIARHMLHMLMECEGHVHAMIKFYCIFIKLADATTSNTFKEYDLNKDGFISYQEFERAMNQQQHYTKDEIDYLMKLADTNKDGLLDYKEFTDRFHQPAHNLGFRLCALVQQLSDILPNDSQAKKLMDLSRELIQHFKGSMGCVEIIGKSSQVERVYFKINSAKAQQWNDPTIKESRKKFLYNLELTNQREKLEAFVNFCEDTIFDMNYNDSLRGFKYDEQLVRAEQHRSTYYPNAGNRNSNIFLTLGGHFDTLASFQVAHPKHFVFKLHSLVTYIWINLIFSFIVKPVLDFNHFIHIQIAFLWHKGEGRLRSRCFRSVGGRGVFLHNLVTSGAYIPRIVYSFGSLGSLLANSYYTVKQVLLVTTLLINVLILVSIENRSHFFTDGAPEANENGTEQLTLTILKWLTHLHFVASIMLVLSSYNRNGQVMLFKQEKRTVRRLEQQTVLSPGSSTLSFMDCLIIKSPSFPRYFWDKQVKERVLNRLCPEHRDEARVMLGMGVRCKFDRITKKQQLMQLMSETLDVRYRLWRLLICCQDSYVVYHMFYCGLSFAGLFFNVFYFSIHLLDLMFHSSTLVTVLKSLQINMKQLIMTFAMTCVVLYIYTVIGFNYFRKFYQTELSGGEILDNCDSMWNCFFFHLDKGLRSGGGIADVLVSATGDQQYMLRLSFDMTFFFIVIVILLAVFQGLIIDAFGELRKKQDSITEELQNKCFICGIGKNEFGSPQEFDSHVTLHHSIRDYMFFMMHLIEKPETEFTGQESHVWEHYVQQQYSFFPAGTCFQIQERQRLREKAITEKNVAFGDAESSNTGKPLRKKKFSTGLFHSKTISGI